MSPLVSNGATSSSHHRTDDSARKHIATELLQTEKNFVDILNIIVKVVYITDGNGPRQKIY